MLVHPDAQLVSEALTGSQLAFEQLVKQHQSRVLRTIATIVSNQQAAQDVAQETFMAAWCDLVKLRDKHKFGPWLNRIAINLSRDWLKGQRKHHQNQVLLDENAVVLKQELRYQTEQLRQEVWEAINELGEEHREVVILHYISGYSYKEIGQMLSVPASTVSGRLQKAKAQLRKEFLDMVRQLQLEIDSTVHTFLKQHARENGVSVEGLVLRLIERYRMDVDNGGGNIRKVSETGLRQVGAPSPDGRCLSFTHWGLGDLAVRDLVAGQDRNLTDGGEDWEKRIHYVGSSVWSPDGKHIAYSWCPYENYDEPHELRIIGLDGSEPRIVYSNGDKEVQGIYPKAWSQDGRYLLVRVDRLSIAGEPVSDIAVVSVKEGSIQILKSMKHGKSSLMSLSSDGCTIVYSHLPEEGGDKHSIFLLATDGSGEEVPLLEHSANDYGPVWTPDGKGVVFGSDRSGNADAWLQQMANGKPVGEPRLIQRGVNLTQPLGFTQDGSLYYTLRPDSTDVYMASIDAATGDVLEPTKKAIYEFETFNAAPSWSPDGRSLAYVSRRPSPERPGRRPVLVIRSVDTGKEHVLCPKVEFDWLSSSHLCWSLDGCSILYGVPGPHAPYLCLVDVSTGDVTTVIELDPERELIWAHAWSADGEWVFYIKGMREEGGRLSIIAHETASGHEKELCQARGTHGLCVSPDGQQLAFVGGGADHAIHVISTAGGTPREVFQSQDRDSLVRSSLAWTSDGRYILFQKLKPGSKSQAAELWRVPAEGGEPEKLVDLGWWYYGFSVHPDGQRIAFTDFTDGREPSLEIWAMENFLPRFTADK